MQLSFVIHIYIYIYIFTLSIRTYMHIRSGCIDKRCYLGLSRVLSLGIFNSRTGASGAAPEKWAFSKVGVYTKADATPLGER